MSISVETHPMLRKKRPPMTTPPILELANAIRAAIEDGHNGMFVFGTGRAGKTYAQRWLMERTGWHSEPLACISVRVPRHTKVYDSYVYQLILMNCRMKHSSRSSSIAALERIRDLFEQVCCSQGTDTLLLFVDEAQRLLNDEIADLLTIVNESEFWDINVFVVFMRQIDVSGLDAERAREQLAPHIKGRAHSDEVGH